MLNANVLWENEGHWGGWSGGGGGGLNPPPPRHNWVHHCTIHEALDNQCLFIYMPKHSSIENYGQERVLSFVVGGISLKQY